MASQEEKSDGGDATNVANSIDEKPDQPSGSLQETEQDTPPGEKSEDGTEVKYVSGWQLVIVLATINLSTLIASLDLVSII